VEKLKKVGLQTTLKEKIRDIQKEIIGIEVVKGKVNPENSNSIHQVDGISGATVTGRGVSVFIAEDLKRYEEYLNKVKVSGTI